MKYCCNNFKYHIIRKVEIEYNPVTRSCGMRLANNEYQCTHQDILYCPWCGYKLPKDLGEIWAKVLKEEYNITDPHVKESNMIPEEFKTDEWWKKRGL